LLLAFAVGGGSPPATYEALRVYEDGAARAVVGNAWPFGHPQYEAGSYEHQVADLEALRAAMAGTQAPAEPIPGAARCELQLPDGRELAWPTTAPSPPQVELLRDLLREVRRHPVGAITLETGPLALSNPGTELLRILSGRVQSGPGADPEALAGAPELDVELPAELPGGARYELNAQPAGGVLAILRAEVPYEGERIDLDCVLVR
jgi:hypothetical protein